MAFGTLYTFKDNTRSIATRAIAKANGLDLNIVEIDRTGPPNQEWLKINPIGKVPAFRGEDGFELTEAIALAIYITSQNEKTTLLGKTKQDYALILKWMSFFNQEILTSIGHWYLPLMGLMPYNKKNVDDAAKQANKCLDVVEAHLVRHTYLVGDRITLADLFCAGILLRGFANFFDKEWREHHPAVTRWYETINAQPIMDESPKATFIDKVTMTGPPKKAEAPKAAPKAAPTPAPVAAAAEEDEPAAAPKPKHPCDLLPRATFPLDEYKRYYSNHETADALKYFWEKVPTDEYSIWRVDYKYNDELTLVFMSNNLIGGFNTRLEGSRKYLFGSASVYGENNNSVIQGAFVIRGQEWMPVFDVAPDYESYSFQKLDPSKEEDRAFLDNMWSWEKGVTVDGKEYPHADGKVFK